jgi:hypothetical protein
VTAERTSVPASPQGLAYRPTHDASSTARARRLRGGARRRNRQTRAGRQDGTRRVGMPGPPDWFTEGFDTADLKDAKALLDALT